MLSTDVITQTDRSAAERHLSDEVVSTRAAGLAFEVEALTDAGPYGLRDESFAAATAIAIRIEDLAAETAAQRPAIARTLRIAAADLRRAPCVSSPAEAYACLDDAFRLLEQL